MNTASSDTPQPNPENQYDIAVVGHANVDIFFTLADNDPDWRLNTKTNELSFTYGEKIAVKEAQYAMGGNGQNVAVGLARLGYKVALLEEIGGDAFAQDIIKNLKDNNVETKHLTHRPEKRTSIGVVMNVKGDRTILSQHVEHHHDVDLSQVAPRLIYLTSLGPIWEDAYTEVLDFAAQYGVPIAFNPGSSQLNQQNDIVKRAISQAHILCVNLDEAKTILQQAHPKSKLDKLSIEEVMSKIAELGPKIVVITDGKNGSYARAEDGRCFQQDILPATVVERTGAGDSFTAGMLGAALAGKSLQKAMYWGAKNAASVVGQVGSEPGLLTREQIESDIDPLLVNLGIDQPMHLFHFGHPDSFTQRLFEAKVDSLSHAQQQKIDDAYAVMYEAVNEAISQGVPKPNIVIEVDPAFGQQVLAQAHEDGIHAALSIQVSEDTEEDSVQQVITSWVDKFDAAYISAVVSFNPAEQAATRKSKKAVLKLISDAAHHAKLKFILDLNIAPHDKQLAQLKDDIEAFNRSLRNDLTIKTIAEFHQAGIEPDAWRFEYTADADDYRRLLKEMQKAEYQQRVGAILSGEDATDEQLMAVMREFADAPQVIGYAAGTHIYKDAVADYLSQEASRMQAKNRIAQEFLYLYQAYRDASQGQSAAPQAPSYQPEAVQVDTLSDQAHYADSEDPVAIDTDPDGEEQSQPQVQSNPFQPASDSEEDANWQEDEAQPKSGLFSRLFKR